MSAQLIYDLVPLGSTLTYSDRSPRPPERHRKKLAAWETRNSGGRLGHVPARGVTRRSRHRVCAPSTAL